MIKFILIGMAVQAISSASVYAYFNRIDIATQQAIAAAIFVLIIITLAIASRTDNIIIASRIDINED